MHKLNCQLQPSYGNKYYASQQEYRFASFSLKNIIDLDSVILSKLLSAAKAMLQDGPTWFSYLLIDVTIMFYEW